MSDVARILDSVEQSDAPFGWALSTRPSAFLRNIDRLSGCKLQRPFVLLRLKLSLSRNTYDTFVLPIRDSLLTLALFQCTPCCLRGTPKKTKLVS
jgi:hypothetical protein